MSLDPIGEGGQPDVHRPRVVVLASGNGSNFQALIDACASGRIQGCIAGLVTDRPMAAAVQRAARAGVAVDIVTRATNEARADYDVRLADAVAARDPDLVVLAGWMRLLTMQFLGRFPMKVINLHPALPGQFPGTNAIERALEAARRSTLRHTGVMVHYVPDEGMDDGPVVATADVEIHADDTLESLAERVHATEHVVLVDAVARLVAETSR